MTQTTHRRCSWCRYRSPPPRFLQVSRAARHRDDDATRVAPSRRTAIQSCTASTAVFADVVSAELSPQEIKTSPAAPVELEPPDTATRPPSAMDEPADTTMSPAETLLDDPLDTRTEAPAVEELVAPDALTPSPTDPAPPDTDKHPPVSTDAELAPPEKVSFPSDRPSEPPDTLTTPPEAVVDAPDQIDTDSDAPPDTEPIETLTTPLCTAPVTALNPLRRFSGLACVAQDAHAAAHERSARDLYLAASRRRRQSASNANGPARHARVADRHGHITASASIAARCTERPDHTRAARRRATATRQRQNR